MFCINYTACVNLACKVIFGCPPKSLKLCNLIKYTPYFNTIICLKLVLNKKSLCAKTLKSGFL